jgi:hypothetical protein
MTTTNPKSALSSFNYGIVPVGTGNMQQTRRAKVVNAIRDQLELLRNPSYKKTTVKRIKGKAPIEKQVAVQPWWKRTSTGGYAVTCRIGGKLIDFQPGSNAIIVPGNGQEAMKAVADVLRALETAVMSGELDQHMVSKAKQNAPKAPAPVPGDVPGVASATPTKASSSKAETKRKAA